MSEVQVQEKVADERMQEFLDLPVALDPLALMLSPIYKTPTGSILKSMGRFKDILDRAQRPQTKITWDKAVQGDDQTAVTIVKSPQVTYETIQAIKTELEASSSRPSEEDMREIRAQLRGVQDQFIVRAFGTPKVRFAFPNQCRPLTYCMASRISNVYWESPWEASNE